MNYNQPKPQAWPWIVMGVFCMLALWAGMQQLDAKAQQQTQRIVEKLAQQKRDDAKNHRTKLDRVAAEVCRDSHGENAVHWWDKSGVLVCAKTREAMNSAIHAAQAMKGN